MQQILMARLAQVFALTTDLVVHLDEQALGLDLPHLPSNRIAGQLWCIVGARESYTRAIMAGTWQGFTCSLTTPRVKRAALEALERSQQQFSALDAVLFSDIQASLALALLEHEVQHHGQLIRFVYANWLTFPASWHERYTV